MLHLRTAVALVATVATIAPAAAQTPPVADVREQARAFVAEGVEAQARGDYDAAIALYQRAYELLPHPALFFNLGQAHRLAGRIEQALVMYRRYLAEVPSGSLADQTRVWIAALETPRDPEPPSSSPPSPPSTTVRAPRITRDEGRGLRMAGLAVAATGVAAVAVGGLYGLEARELDDEISTPRAGYDLDKVAAGERAERRMFVYYGVGGALLVGGAALLGIGWSRRDRPVRIAPVAAGGRAGLAVVGRF